MYKKIFLFTILFSFNLALAADKLLHVSYDANRELFKDINYHFNKYYQEKYGKPANIYQSHGGSAKQAKSVMHGLNADIVSLALPYDIDMIAKEDGLINADWEQDFPHDSSPYYSIVVFLVRKDNPKQIHDWPDLLQDNLEIVTPNPKTSGIARWNYLAAWTYALHQNNSEEEAKDFIRHLFQKVKILDSASRSSTINFTRRNIGDVLITTENEAMLALAQSASAKEYEIIYPSYSIKAPNKISLVHKNAARNQSTELAKEYINFLYSKQGQEIIAKHYFRPVENSPPVKLLPIPEGNNWQIIQKKHFISGGIFDQIASFDKN